VGRRWWALSPLFTFVVAFVDRQSHIDTCLLCTLHHWRKVATIGTNHWRVLNEQLVHAFVVVDIPGGCPPLETGVPWMVQCGSMWHYAQCCVHLPTIQIISCSLGKQIMCLWRQHKPCRRWSQIVSCWGSCWGSPSGLTRPFIHISQNETCHASTGWLITPLTNATEAVMDQININNVHMHARRRSKG